MKPVTVPNRTVPESNGETATEETLELASTCAAAVQEAPPFTDRQRFVVPPRNRCLPSLGLMPTTGTNGNLADSSVTSLVAAAKLPPSVERRNERFWVEK